MLPQSWSRQASATEAETVYRFAELFQGKPALPTCVEYAKSPKGYVPVRRTVIGRGPVSGTLFAGVQTKTRLRMVGCYPALLVACWPWGDTHPDAQTQHANDAIWYWLSRGFAEPTGVKVVPGPVLTCGGTVLAGDDPRPIYPHRLGLKATIKQLWLLDRAQEGDEAADPFGDHAPVDYGVTGSKRPVSRIAITKPAAAHPFTITRRPH